MAKVFVSYSRKDIEFAKRLTGELQKGELDFWIDWEGIPPTVDWWKEIEKGIEEADVFLFIMSPDSVKSKVCGQETDHAAKNGKRLIPVVARDIKTDDAPPQLRPLNWIFLRENDDFDAAVKKLQTAIQTDYEWVQTQRRLQVKALEWERINHESSFLLRGKDLQDAELQLATNSSKEPNPTDLQRDYVFKSRQAVDRQRRTITGISIAGIIALAALAVFGFVQAGLATSNATESKNNAATAQANLVVANTAQANAESARAAAQASEAEALTQKQIAEKSANEVLAGNLAAQADSLKNNDHALALLLGMEAYQRKPDILSRTTLFQLLQFTPYTRLFGFHGQVSSVATSPDGKWIAVGSSNEISILDANTRQIIFSTSDGLGLVNSLAFNNDGTLLATGGCVPESCDSRGQITVWDMRDPQKPLLSSDVSNSHTAPVTTLAFSPDGKILATGSDDRTITLWDAETLNQNGKPVNSTGQITSLAFSPDGKTLVSAGSDRSINIWDVSAPATAKLMGTAPAQHTGVISSIAFGPLESGKFASASEDNTVALWDWDSNSRALSNPKKLEGHGGFVQSVTFNEAGTVLASTGFDRTVILWDAQTGERIGSALSVHTKAINAVVFGKAETQNALFSGSSDGTVVLWDLATQQPVSQPVAEESSPEGIGQTAKSGEVEAKAEGSQISLTGSPDPLIGHTGQVNTLNFSPQKVDDRLLLVSASADQTVIVWDVSNVSEAGVFLKLAGFDSPVSSAFFSADGKQLTTIEDNGHTTRWSIDPSDWTALACKAVKDNLTTNQWASFLQYLSGQLPAETCVTQP